MNSNYAVANGMYVDQRMQVELANNGMTGDDALVIYAAPQNIAVAEPAVIVYMATNGDPVVLGWIDADNDVNVLDSADEEDRMAALLPEITDWTADAETMQTLIECLWIRSGRIN